MDINKAFLNSLNQSAIDTKRIEPNRSPSSQPNRSDSAGSVSFKDALQDRLTKEQALQNPSAGAKGLNQEAQLKFSGHAVDRMRSRGIHFSPQDLNKLEAAVEKASTKGSRDALVLMKDSAVIVSVKNKTVVTVVDQNSIKDNVFTNIDSTIVI